MSWHGVIEEVHFALHHVPPYNEAQCAGAAGYGPWRPFLAPLLANARMTAAGHARDTRLLALGLRGSGLAYAPGDLAAILPAQVGPLRG